MKRETAKVNSKVPGESLNQGQLHTELWASQKPKQKRGQEASVTSSMSIREREKKISVHKAKSTLRDRVAFGYYGNSEKEVTHSAWENQEMLHR